MTTTGPGARTLERFVVADSRPAAREQRLVVVEAGAAALEYTRAGQVVEMEHGGVRAYMVIASPLSERPRLSFLVRTGRGEVADAVAAVPAGGTVSMTRPFGPGFPLDRVLWHRLVCCVAGTGIAAVRPVLAELAAQRTSLATAKLYYGVCTPEDVAFRDELEAWAARGLGVRICLSRERARDAWDREGRVPEVLAVEEKDLRDAAIVLAGPREMGPAVQKVASAAALPPGRLLTNF